MTDLKGGAEDVTGKLSESCEGRWKLWSESKYQRHEKPPGLPGFWVG